MRKSGFAFFVALVFFFLSGAVHAGEKIMAFCGAASEVPMEEAAKVFQQKTGIQVELIWGGSGSVMSQMKLSKRGDLFIPGSPDYMTIAVREGLVDPKTVKIIAYLVPAINVQKGNPQGIKELKDLARPGLRVAIGNPESVCVGLYAVEILEKNGLLKAVEKNIVTHAASCSATAALINLKKVDAIMGWNVFEQWNPEKTETIFLKPEQVPRLAYIPAAITKDYAENRAGAQAFIDFLISPEGRAIFSKYGYPASEKEVRKYAPKAKIGGEYILPADYRPFAN
jgi:molybdate transport system substrate-binding protein